MADPGLMELVPVDHNPWEAQTTPWPQDAAPMTAQQRYRAAQAGDESRMPSFQRTGPTLPGMIAQSMEDTGRMMTTPPPAMPRGAYMDAGGPAQGTANPQEFANWLGEMRQRGDLAPSMALGMIGGGTAFAPRSALGSAGAKMLQPAAEATAEAAQPGIRAYHGSPHDFTQFDLSKIGTGEGAQAYGHGLYFAENEPVAKQYRNALSKPDLPNPGNAAEAKIINEMQTYGLNDPVAAFHRVADMEGITGTARKELEDGLGNIVRNMKPGGHMYEVNIGAHPSQFLDWDKPLSEQHPKVREALGNVPWADEYLKSGTLTGGQIAPKTLEGVQQLRDAGIPGIRYLNQGSRNATPVMTTTPHGDVVASHYPAPTSNYVVFNPKMIEILRKYGIIGAAGGMGAGAMQQQYPLPFQPGM